MDVIVCDHENEQTYELSDISTYFEKKYYDKHPNAPSFCGTCSEKKTFGIDVPVNAKNPVYICGNKKCVGQQCNHAICKQCFDKLNEKNNANISKKRKRITKPRDVFE